MLHRHQGSGSSGSPRWSLRKCAAPFETPSNPRVRRLLPHLRSGRAPRRSRLSSAIPVRRAHHSASGRHTANSHGRQGQRAQQLGGDLTAVRQRSHPTASVTDAPDLLHPRGFTSPQGCVVRGALHDLLVHERALVVAADPVPAGRRPRRGPPAGRRRPAGPPAGTTPRWRRTRPPPPRRAGRDRAAGARRRAAPDVPGAAARGPRAPPRRTSRALRSGGRRPDGRPATGRAPPRKSRARHASAGDESAVCLLC